MAVVNSSRINLSEGIDWVIKKYLEGYQAEVIRAATEVVPEVAKDTAKMLRQVSPVNTGKYHKGWTYKVERKRMSVGATIYGRKGTYQIAHLLEYGHAKRGGGRVSAIAHIKPVEEWANGELIDRTIERLSSL